MHSAGVAAVTERLAAGDVRLLVSNTGAAGRGRLADTTPATIDPVLTLNGVATMELVRTALPGTLAANNDTIITVGLTAGLQRGDYRRPHSTSPPATPTIERDPADVGADNGLHRSIGSAILRKALSCNWRTGQRQ
jgi:hypothetical protein